MPRRDTVLLLLLCTATAAYESDQLPRALGPALSKGSGQSPSRPESSRPPRARPGPGLDTLNFRSTGSPVPGGWKPNMQGPEISRDPESAPSVGLLTEQRAHPDAIITYIQPNVVSQFAARFSKHARGGQAPAGKPNPPVHVSYTAQGVVNEVNEAAQDPVPASTP